MRIISANLIEYNIMSRISRYQESIEKFIKNKINFKPRYFPESNLYQLFITDPNGVMIELNFFNITSENAPKWEGEDYSKMERVSILPQ